MLVFPMLLVVGHFKIGMGEPRNGKARAPGYSTTRASIASMDDNADRCALKSGAGMRTLFSSRNVMTNRSALMEPTPWA